MRTLCIPLCQTNIRLFSIISIITRFFTTHPLVQQTPTYVKRKRINLDSTQTSSNFQLLYVKEISLSGPANNHRNMPLLSNNHPLFGTHCKHLSTQAIPFANGNQFLCPSKHTPLFSPQCGHLNMGPLPKRHSSISNNFQRNTKTLLLSTPSTPRGDCTPHKCPSLPTTHKYPSYRTVE
jgi:hypothetical protein